MGSALWGNGIRYRKHYNVSGKPDFVIPRLKIAIFCDSNFWHGKNWGEERKSEFKKNKEFWIKKIERNIERDKEVNEELTNQGWQVIRLWEDEILNNIEGCINKVIEEINLRKLLFFGNET